MSIARNFLKGSVLNTANFFIQVAVVFLITPILIGALGERHYGFWILVVSIVGYSTLFDLGISSSVARYASRAWGQGDNEEIRAVVATAFRLFCLIGLFVLILAIALGVLGPRFWEDAGEGEFFRFAVLLLGLGAALSFPVKAFLGLLKAYVRIDLLVAATLARFLTANVLIFFLLPRGHGLVALAWITFGTTLLEYLLIYLFARRVFSGKLLVSGSSSPDLRGKLFHYSKYSFCIQICGAIKTKFDALIIASLLSLTLVAYYAIAMRLLHYFVDLVGSMMGGGILSIFSRYEGQSREDLLRKRLVDATKVSTFFAVFIGASILFYGEPFLLRWLGPSFLVSYDLLLILTVPFTLSAMQIPGVFLLYGVSRHKSLAMSTIAEATVNLALKLLLTSIFGLTGFALAVAIEGIFFSIFVRPALYCRAVDLSLFHYFRDALIVPAAKTLLLLLPSFWLIRDFLVPAYPQLVGFGLLQSVLIIPVGLGFVLGVNEVRSLVRTFLFSRVEAKSDSFG